MKIIKILLLLSLIFASAITFAQEPKMDESHSVKVEKLPEYIIIQSESTARLLGQKIIYVDRKNSDYAQALAELDDLLTNRKKLGIRSQTDLLNAMSGLGFDYVDAFTIGQGDMTNMVFRKRQEYRNP